MKILEDKITDRRFTNLIWKALAAGYLEFRTYKSEIPGTPKGSIISPILANIFLHQLDLYVMELHQQLDQGNRAPRSKILKARSVGDTVTMRKLIPERYVSPSFEFRREQFQRLVYVRYANELIIGIRGTHEQARFTLKKIKEFCDSIELNLSETKTKLTPLNTDSVIFLGTQISRSNHVSFSRLDTIRKIKRHKLGIRFEAPLDRIKQNLAKNKFMLKGKSAPKFH